MFRIVCDPSSVSTELCLTEITLSDSQIFFVRLVCVWQRNFEPVVCVCVCVCVCVRYDGLGTTSVKHSSILPDDGSHTIRNMSE